MTLTGKKYTRMYSTTGSDADLISSDKVSKIQDSFNSNEYLLDENALEAHGHLIYQIQQMQDELDYLRTEIAVNKAKAPISTGANTVISFGDMVFTTVKGKTTYSIVMTVAYTDPSSSKVTTKTTTLNLA